MPESLSNSRNNQQNISEEKQEVVVIDGLTNLPWQQAVSQQELCGRRLGLLFKKPESDEENEIKIADRLR